MSTDMGKEKEPITSPQSEGGAPPKPPFHHPLSGWTLIFFPGIDGTGISFEPLGRLLPEDVTVKIVRYPIDRLFGFEETVEWAREQIHPDGKNVMILAESFSGPVAVALVGSGRLKARCLILCATFARSPRPVLLKIVPHLPLGPLMRPRILRLFLKYIYKDGKDSADLFIAMWQRVRLMVPMRVLKQRLKIIDEVDVRGWLPKLSIPCCYIRASSDRAVPLSSLFDFVGLVPDLKIISIEGPHFILQARPQESLAAIQDFADCVGVQLCG